MMGCLVIDFKEFANLHFLIYAACVGLLFGGYLACGAYRRGSQRWLVLGPVRIQTSELMKISLIISLASVYSESISPEGLGFAHLIKPALLMCHSWPHRHPTRSWHWAFAFAYCRLSYFICKGWKKSFIHSGGGGALSEASGMVFRSEGISERQNFNLFES